MAWTAPKTFTAANVLTAAELNEQLRDNLLESLPAISNEEGGFFVTGSSITESKLVQRFPDSARVNTAEATTSTSYTDLATVGPSVTVTTGTDAFVMISSMMWQSTIDSFAGMSWDITGATTRTAQGQTSCAIDGLEAVSQVQHASYDLMTSLTPGVNTFTAKYRCGSNTASFSNRCIFVFPL